MKKSILILVSLFFMLFLFSTCSGDDNSIVQYTLSTEASPPNGGSISPSSGKYSDGESVSLLATASADYVFMNWSGGVTGTDNPATTIMNSDKTATAVFEKKEVLLALQIIGVWKIKDSFLDGVAVTSQDFVEFTVDKKVKFTYLNDGGNIGVDVVESGKWVINGKNLTITWDSADPGNETYILEITELNSTTLKWKTIIIGEGTLIETFTKQL